MTASSILMSDNGTSIPRTPGPARRRQGFTFLEIMVSLAILSIVLTAVYRMQSQTISMNTEKQFLTLAPLLGAGRLAAMESTALENDADESGDFGEDYPGYHWRLTVAPVDSELLSTAGAGLVRIDMTVSYQEDAFTLHLQTYRFVQK